MWPIHIPRYLNFFLTSSPATDVGVSSRVDLYSTNDFEGFTFSPEKYPKIYKAYMAVFASKIAPAPFPVKPRIMSST